MSVGIEKLVQTSRVQGRGGGCVSLNQQAGLFAATGLCGASGGGWPSLSDEKSTRDGTWPCRLRSIFTVDVCKIPRVSDRARVEGRGSRHHCPLVWNS